MPELPEVESLRRCLEPRVKGRRVTGVEVHLPRIVRAGNLADATDCLITAVRRFGKYLAFETDRSRALFFHMRMTGTLLWSSDLTAEPSHIRARLNFPNGSVLFRDIRTLGGVWVLPTGEVPWRQMGIDPLKPDFNGGRLLELLGGRRQPLKAALLDQSLIAGIGNIYASEALFAARLHPLLPAGSLSPVESDRLSKAIRRILRAAIDSGGTTFRDFRLSNGREGAFRAFLKVYNRAGESCPRCGTAVVRSVIRQRSTYHCPKCQQLPFAEQTGR